MWECPDFFALDGAHVLIYSTLGTVYWQSGELDTKAMIFHPKKTGGLDLGGFYAPKTPPDTHGRRILRGWLQEKRSEEDMRAAGWSGMMSLPRVINLDKDGALRVTMLPELASLRADKLLSQRAGGLLRQTPPGASGRYFVLASRGAHLS